MAFASWPLAQQIAMATTVGTVVPPHDVAVRIDPVGDSSDSAGDVNRCKGPLSCHSHEPYSQQQ